MNILRCYQILSVPPGATLRQVHRAYKRLVLLHHPDRTNNDPRSLERFCEATEAYSTLKAAYAARQLGKGAGPCPKCERIGKLYRGLDGSRSCAECLLAKRRRFLPLPTYETVRCAGVIAIQALAVYCVGVTMVVGDLQHGVAAVVLLLAALGILAYDFWTADVIER